MPALLQILVLVLALGLCIRPLGDYMARVYTSPKHLRVERGAYRLLRIDPDADQRWSTYAVALLGFSLVSILFLYAFGRLQQLLPLSLGDKALPASGAFNTAISFATNTDWQWYSGEAATGHLIQMAGLAVQNFASAAVGMAVAVALIRGIARTRADGRVGNFWSDLVRTVVRILLPLAFVAAIVLVALGVVQNFASPHVVHTLAGQAQHLTGGPVASQEAIKEVGTNGGGFYNANSAHPYENPGPFSNILEIFLLLVIPFSLTRTFGVMVKDKRQGWAILAVMSTILITSIGLLTWAEMAGHGTAPQLAGGAMEGKEVRFGTAASALFAAATTGTSTGSVNSMHDSLTASGGGVTMFNMMLGEVAPGGTGSGLYGLLVLAILSVFVAGLMVGRTPEYLGKKIRGGEMKLVATYILTTPAIVLIGGAIAVSFHGGLVGLEASGPHGLSEAVYAVTSAGNNNGSAFGGLTSGTPFWNILLGMCMLLGRFVPMLLVLGLAGRLATQQKVPPSAGTLPTHRPLFVGLLIGVTLVVVGLTYIPVLSLAPIAEALK
ncbi:MAG: potassium-transporting ATPase, subunit [Marmoricola sp.]|jgi:K+-transporting ATPase ATPase A chain|nr:potassium-transporting ATPase, subunit [Marmoricola sp.]